MNQQLERIQFLELGMFYAGLGGVFDYQSQGRSAQVRDGVLCGRAYCINFE